MKLLTSRQIQNVDLAAVENPEDLLPGAIIKWGVRRGIFCGVFKSGFPLAAPYFTGRFAGERHDRTALTDPMSIGFESIVVELNDGDADRARRAQGGTLYDGGEPRTWNEEQHTWVAQEAQPYPCPMPVWPHFALV